MSIPAACPYSIRQWIEKAVGLMQRIPDTLIALVARLSIAAVFWRSGQTKIEGLAIDLVHGTFELGIPKLSSSAVYLFRTEYQVPLLPAETAALIAAFSEHLFPVLIVLGLATRFSALALLGMTLTIQLFVYPDAYPTHGTWIAILLYLMAKGPGAMSLDHVIAQRFR